MPGILLPSRRFYESSYTEEVLATDPIAHYTLGERFGSVAYDTTQNHFNGAITGATLGRPGIGDGLTSMFFDGALDFVNIYSVPFRDAFALTNNDTDPISEGAVAQWIRVFDIGVWTDAAWRYSLHLGVDGNNRVILFKRVDNNQFEFLYAAGGVEERINYVTTETGWFHAALTWSASAGVDGEVKAYIDGAQIDVTRTGLGVWAGNVNVAEAIIGAANLGALFPWHGRAAHPAVWNRPITPAEVALLYRARWTR